MSGFATGHMGGLLVGWFLGLAWLYRLIENISGMRHVDDITDPEFDVAPGARLPALRVVVPARNEERAIEECLASLLAVDYPALEIIAIDDRSTDSTGTIMDRVAKSGGDKLRVIHVTELPPGWLGKTHAMWLGASQAPASLPEWILFTDGDIFFRSDSLQRAIAYAEQHHADHLGLAPSTILHGIGEPTIMSFFMTMFALFKRPWRVPDPKAKDSVGIGAFNLIRREVYEKVGTYEALRLEVIDDLQMGDRVKRAGFAQRLVYGPGLLRLHWGRGAFGILGNLTKNVFALVRFQLWQAVAMTVGLLFSGLVPIVGLFLASGAAKIGYGVAVLSIFGLYASMSRFNQISPIYCITYPVSCLLIAATIVRSTVETVLRGGIVWRGTKYSLRELREHLKS